MKEPKRLYFGQDEYGKRLSNVRRMMSERGVDALLACAVDNMYYVSGYDGVIGGYQYSHLVIPEEGDLTLLVHEVDLGDALQTTWVEDIRTWKHGQVPEKRTKDMLKELNLDDKAIGIELQSRSISPASYLLLRELLPRVKLVDTSDLITELANIKSPKEIEYMRKAAEIAGKGAKAGIAAIKEGATEREVAFEVNRVLYEEGGEYSSIFCLGSGTKSAALHQPPTERVMKKGDVVTLEPSGQYRRYSASILRTASIGPPGEKVRKLHALCKEAVVKGTEAIKPGANVGEVDRITREITLPFDKYRCHRSGFSMGIAYSNGRTTHRMGMSVLRGDSHIFKPGMVISLEPNFSDLDDEIGILLGNNVLVTETGCEPLYDLPLDLVEK